MFNEFIKFTRQIFDTNQFIPLHEPSFKGNEKKYINETIDSTFVSSVGEFVDKFEKNIAKYTGSNHAIATVNGTSALHVALKLAGVNKDDQVITQSLNFVASINAIYYCNATPLFIDVSKESLGICPESLSLFLESNCELRDDGYCWNKKSNRLIRACLPMHTFGLPSDMDRIKSICDQFNIVIVEDAAESLGSFYKDSHTGTIGKLGILSFNGNKIITTGGGGMIITDDEETALAAKHLTTTAKVVNGNIWEHDQIGFNYRLPNINAALGLAQLERIQELIDSKRLISNTYKNWFKNTNIRYVSEQNNTKSNYWLNTILLDDKETRDIFLRETNENDIQTRGAWKPMHQLSFVDNRDIQDLSNTEWLYDRIVNIPSSPISY